jgi:hypothetical protein
MVQSVTAIGNQKSAGINYSVSLIRRQAREVRMSVKSPSAIAARFAAVPFVSLWHVAPFFGVARNWSLSGLKTDMLEKWWAV